MTLSLLEQLPHGLAGGLQLAVDGCVGLGRPETQASQEVTSFTIDRIHETALKTSRQIYCYSRSSAVFKPFSKFLGCYRVRTTPGYLRQFKKRCHRRHLEVGLVHPLTSQEALDGNQGRCGEMAIAPGPYNLSKCADVSTRNSKAS